MNDIPRYKKDEQRKEKQCKFPGCEATFIGTGKSCYCLIHRDRMFRKFIDADKIKEKKEKIVENANVNKIIEHTFHASVEEKHQCELCNEEFIITVIPGVKIYPKYCPEHRNEYKRKLYIERQKVLII